MLITEALDLYKRDCVPELAERTQRDYARHIETLRKEFGHIEADALKPRDVAKFLDVPKGKIHRVRIVAVLSAVYTKMIGRWFVAEKNPCQHVEKQKNPPRDKYVTDEEYSKFYNFLPERLKIAMELALLTGQRQGDILKLTWFDVQRDGITFHQSKTGQSRHILYTDRLREVMERARKLGPFTPRYYVVRNERGWRYVCEGFRSNWQRMKRLAKAKGLMPVNWVYHDLRAKCVSDEDDVDTAQLRAGHTSKAMTLRVYSRKVRRVVASR